MAGMLSAVQEFMGTSDYYQMFKLAMLLALLTLFLSLLSDKGFSPVMIFQKIILIIGLQALLFSPISGSSKVTVNIYEVMDGVINPKVPDAVIQNVNVVVAFPLYVLSNIEKAARDTFRASLNKGAVQNGVFLQGMSVIRALNVMDTANNIRINDTNFLKSFQSFMENCIMPDVVTGYIDPANLTASKGKDDKGQIINQSMWDIFGINLHKSRIGNYYDGTKGTIDGEIMTCNNLHATMDRKMNVLTNSAKEQIGGQLGLSGIAEIDAALGTVSKDLFNFQKGQTDLVEQAMMMNTFSDAYANLSGMLGMADNALGYGMAKQQETAKMQGAMQAIQAKKYLPLAKGYLTVIFVAMVPFILIIALITSNFKKPFAMIFGLLLALALWNVGEQLLDYIIITRTQSLYKDAGLMYNLDNQIFISSGITDMLNLSLSMYWMIPTLAFSIATLSGYGAASMMGSIASSAGAGVSGAAAEAATGSMSMGNIRMSNINMNKYDAAHTMNAGTSTRMSLDHQQTASNQGSVLTGQQNNHKDSDKIEHEGTTWIKGPNGQEYELNGTFKQTAAGWEATGTFIDKNGTSWHGTMTGTAKNMEAFQNNAKNGDEAVFQATSIDTSHLSKTHKTEENEIYENINRYQKTKEHVVGNTVEDRGDGGALKLNGDAIKQDIVGGTDRSGYLDNAYQHYKNMRNAEALHDMGKLNDEQLSYYREQYDRYMAAYSSAAASVFETQYVGNKGSSGSDTDTTSTSKSASHKESNQLYVDISAGGGISASGGVGINDSLSQSGGGDGPDKSVSQAKGANANVNAGIRAGNKISDTLETSTSQSQTSQQSASSQISDSRNTNNTQAVIRNQLDMTFESAYRNGQNNLDSNTALKGLNTLHNNNF